MKIFSKLPLLAITATFFLGNSQKEPAETGKAKELVPLMIRFDNIAGSENLALNEKEYTNAAGEKFTVSQLQYFVSNIKLRRKDGTVYTIKQDDSYFLIQEDQPATHVIKLKVPPGDYDRLDFIAGVDSLRNTMNISRRTGVLDPASSMDNGMYWSWNSGYIFFKMEGESVAAPADPTGNRKFRYHIGGFGGYSAPTINNIKTISLNLAPAGIAKVRKNRKSTILVQADILKVFNATTNISIATHSSVMFSEYSVNIANNYSNMFTHQLTEN